MEPEAITQIASILRAVFEIEQPKQAALKLRRAGYRSDELHAFGRTRIGREMPDYQINNTYNELRTLEIDAEKTDG